MNEETKKIVRGAFEKLPKQLQDAILAADLPEKFRTIMTKHKLQLDQAADVENETMLVMLGLEHPDEYTKNITREAELDPAKAREIAEDVNRMIFLPIRTTLRELHEREVAEEQRETQPATPSLRTTEEGEVAQNVTAMPSQYDAGLLRRPAPFKDGKKSDADIFKEKMGGMTRMPKEVTPLHLKRPAAPAEPHKTPALSPERSTEAPLTPHSAEVPSTAGRQVQARPTLSTKAEHDQYREPINEADIASFKKETTPSAPLQPKSTPPSPPAGSAPKAEGQSTRASIGIERGAEKESVPTSAPKPEQERASRAPQGFGVVKTQPSAAPQAPDNLPTGTPKWQSQTKPEGISETDTKKTSGLEKKDEGGESGPQPIVIGKLPQ